MRENKTVSSSANVLEKSTVLSDREEAVIG